MQLRTHHVLSQLYMTLQSYLASFIIFIQVFVQRG